VNQTLEQARALAREAHGDQRYGALPYKAHLEAVVAVLERFGVNANTPEGEALLCAAWLHDTLEDTTLEPSRIAAVNSLALGLVRAVTDEPGETRSEKKARTYPKIRAQPLAVVLKLADRIANVEASLEAENVRKLETYRREHAVFKEALHDPNDSRAAPLWTHLNALFETP
jgi:(p)ppGpp synthase/HD superfamily hydrolase